MVLAALAKMTFSADNHRLNGYPVAFLNAGHLTPNPDDFSAELMPDCGWQGRRRMLPLENVQVAATDRGSLDFDQNLVALQRGKPAFPKFNCARRGYERHGLSLLHLIAPVP